MAAFVDEARVFIRWPADGIVPDNVTAKDHLRRLGELAAAAEAEIGPEVPEDVRAGLNRIAALVPLILIGPILASSIDAIAADASRVILWSSAPRE